MKPYVPIDLGEVPAWFYDRERDFYRCLAFAALLVAQEREWTGYKELEYVSIDADDLMILGIIGSINKSGSYKVHIKHKVTYNGKRDSEEYWLDTTAFGRTNITDTLIDKNSVWLIDSATFTSYDDFKFNSLPKKAQDWFLRTVQFGLRCPAEELLDKLIWKINNKDCSYSSRMADALPEEIKQWFLKKVQEKDFVDDSANDFLLKVYDKYVVKCDQTNEPEN